jgi:hypothetical protein
MCDFSFQATAMLAKTLVSTQHLMQLTPESQSHTLNSSRENLWTRNLISLLQQSRNKMDRQNGKKSLKIS